MRIRKGNLVTKQEFVKLELLITRLSNQRSLKLSHEVASVVVPCLILPATILLIPQVLHFLIKMWLGLMITFSTIMLFPPILSVAIASMIKREKSADSIQLLRLTNVSLLEFMWAYTGAMLFRLRIPVKIVFILMPISIYGTTITLIRIDPWFYGCIPSLAYTLYCNISLDREQLSSIANIPLFITSLIVADSFFVSLLFIGLSTARLMLAKPNKLVAYLCLLLSFLVGLLLAATALEITFYSTFEGFTARYFVYNTLYLAIPVIGILLWTFLCRNLPT
jgi:hypothetical protein